MPTYDYVCNNCEHAFELFQAMSARLKRKCPECGEKSLERLIGAGAAVIFKGSGFYETDYRSDSYKKAVEAEGKAGKSASDSKSAGSTDSGSAEKQSTGGTDKSGGKSTSAAEKTSADKPSTDKSSAGQKRLSEKKR